MDKRDGQRGFGDEHGTTNAQRSRRRLGCWVAVVAPLFLGGFAVLMLAGGIISSAFSAPEARIYRGRDVPVRFTRAVVEMGALEPDEELLYFYYPDDTFGIDGGFAFVSDRKLAVYLGDEVGSDGEGLTLTLIAFDQIESAELERDASLTVHSTLFLVLKSGAELQFSLPSEKYLDMAFHEEILDRMK